MANAVQANLLAAVVTDPAALGRAYNVACGERTSLNELFALIRADVARFRTAAAGSSPVYRAFRAGDVRHSLADIDRARTLLGYEPTHRVAQGLAEAAAWYAGSVVSR